jgi:hypothetical protein
VARLPLGPAHKPGSLVRRVVLLCFDGEPQQLLADLAEFACCSTEVVVVREGGAPGSWRAPDEGGCSVRSDSALALHGCCSAAWLLQPLHGCSCAAMVAPVLHGRSSHCCMRLECFLIEGCKGEPQVPLLYGSL